MKHNSIVKSGLILLVLGLFGCGGGGGGSSSSGTPGARKATVKLFTKGSLPSGNTIKGIAAEINLPSGVSVKTDANGVLASDLFPSGAATAPSIFSGNVSDSKVTINVGDSNGIAVGEFATLVCDVAYNAPSPLGDFTISNVKVSDVLSGNSVLLSTVTVDKSVTVE